MRLPIALRTEALESLLVERNLVDPKVMHIYVRMYEETVGLAALVTRDAMTGVAKVARPRDRVTGVTELLDIDGPASPPRLNGELVFAEPWESRAFGLAVALNASGAIEWESFRQQLIANIAGWEADHTDGETFNYYRFWLRALEQVLVSQGLVDDDDMVRRGEQLAARAPGHDHHHRHDV